MFSIINKTCFRGMHRVGPNVPYGNYKKINILTEEELKYISDLIKEVEFKTSNFKYSIKKVTKNDFVYLDPPYAPKDPKSFVKYVIDGFDLKMHRLFI